MLGWVTSTYGPDEARIMRISSSSCNTFKRFSRWRKGRKPHTRRHLWVGLIERRGIGRWRQHLDYAKLRVRAAPGPCLGQCAVCEEAELYDEARIVLLRDVSSGLDSSSRKAIGGGRRGRGRLR